MLEIDYASRLPLEKVCTRPNPREAVAKTISQFGLATVEQIAEANHLKSEVVVVIMAQLQAQFDIRGNNTDGYELSPRPEMRSALARYTGGFRSQRLSQPMYSSRSR